MKAHRTFILAGLACAILGTGAFAQEDASDADNVAALREAQAAMKQARVRLEEAAQEVARLSAQRVGPMMRNIIVAEDGEFPRPTLGLIIQDADDGVLVTGVTPNGPAAEAGLKTGDLIVEIDGEDLAPSNEQRPTRLLLRHMASVEPGESVTLAVERDGERMSMDVEARLMGPSTYSFRRGGGPSVGDVRVLSGPLGGPGPGDRFFAGGPGFLIGPWQDMELVPLTPALGEYFGTDEGLLVVRAPEDASIGLVDGDVILEIGGRKPVSAEHALRILGSFEPGEELELAIMRMRHRQTLSIELDEPSTPNFTRRIR